MIDIFAWIVLLILVASAIAIFFIAGSLPGHIAKSRGHPWATAVTVAGWVTLICGFVLWPIALIWAYVDIPAPRFFPGQVFAGKVVSVLEATSTGQVLASGTAVAPTQVTAAPFVVRVKLDDAKLAASLPVGTAGDAAIYTPHIKPAHVIRKVILRQIAILNYVNPF